ncbi:hypothetical protein E3P98_00510 [Wallemia ichthyophaga]|nr:hypothetical protein E3P98_00510 [Wallemia ichthyophaga]
MSSQPVASLNAPPKLKIRPTKLSAGQCSYVSLCKLVLRKRMIRLVLLTFLSTCTIFSVSTSNLNDRISSTISLNRFLFAAVAFSLSVIPIIITRKLALITKPPPSPSSPSQRIKSFLLNNKTYSSTSVYALSAVIYAISFLACVSTHEEDAQFTPFTTHKRRGWQFNERFIFFILNAIVLAISYSIYQLWTDRFITRFPSNISQSISERVLTHLKRNLASGVKFSIITVLTCLSSYFLLKKPIYRTLATFSLSTFRPHLFSLLRQNNLSFGLILRTMLFTISLTTTWEVANTLFDVYSVHPMLISKVSPASNDCLLDGLGCEDTYYRHLAYLEFVMVFSTDKQRRLSVYGDINRNPTSWDKYLGLAVKEMSDGRNKLLSRGATSDAAIDKPFHHLNTPSTATSTATSSSGKHLRVLQDEKIYQRPPRNTFESTVDQSQSPKSTPSSLLKDAPKPLAKGTQDAVIGFDKLLPKDLLRMLRKILNGNEQAVVNAKIKLMAPEMKLVSLSALGLAYLGAASINEDQYGLIQHSIPHVIAQLTETLIVYERFQSELLKSTTHIHEFNTRMQELRNALSVILVAFKDYIATFNLDEQVSGRVDIALRDL